MASIKALLLRYNHTTTWKHHTLVTKNSAERATQAASLQSKLAKLLWYHRLLLISVVIINTKSALRLYFNYFPFSNPKLARGSKKLYNPALDLAGGYTKRRKQIQYRLRLWAAPFAGADRWARLLSKTALLNTSTGLNTKLYRPPLRVGGFRSVSNSKDVEGGRLVLFGVGHGRHKQLVKLKKAAALTATPSPVMGLRSRRLGQSRIWALASLISPSTVLGSGRRGRVNPKRPKALRNRATVLSHSDSRLAPTHDGEAPRLCSQSMVKAKVVGKKPRRARRKSKKKFMTIKDQLAHQRTLEYMKLMAREAQAAVDEMEREEAEQKAAAERKRKIESGEISPITPPTPNKFDLALDHFFESRKAKGRGGPATAKVHHKKPVCSQPHKPTLLPHKAAPQETKVAPTASAPILDAKKVGGELMTSWGSTTLRQPLTSLRERYMLLHVGRALSGLLRQRVSLAGRNALSLSVGDIFAEYKRQVLSSLPHQYVTRLFFINDLVSAVIATTLLRSSNILSFYLARLLERLPRHTWFFHIFNRVMSVFKFYCRAPISLKVLVKGRVNKKLRKQTVCVLRTQVALSTLDCAVDYSLTHSFTSASVLGIKVWVVSNSRAAKTKTFSQRYKTY